MTYQEAVDYLYSQTPQFQQIGAAAYKPGLQTVRALDAAFGHPHQAYRAIHVGGTNGKGSTAHTLAAVLAAEGYKVGLYTSPHLVDFRERIRVNGQMITPEGVTNFLGRYMEIKEGLAGEPPSFFELTTMMAFDWFRLQGVDVAVVEVGLGGLLDSTNIINPELAVITNISRDHMAQLGNTLPEIAAQKAGIMKSGVPVVVGEVVAETEPVFRAHAAATGSPLIIAQQLPEATDEAFGPVDFELKGECQWRNRRTILAALLELRRRGWRITPRGVRQGMEHVVELTGLMGRWMTVGSDPQIVCDTGHNEGGWQYLSAQLRREAAARPVWGIIGFVNDKDLSHLLPTLPGDVRWVFTRASVPRALPAETLQERARAAGLLGPAFPTVALALEHARAQARAASGSNPLIFVGGSTFVVADLLRETQKSGTQA